MVSELLVSAFLLAGTPLPQTQKSQTPVTPEQGAVIANAPPIKMGLWEADISTARGTALKTRSCLTPQSYREELAHMPPGCSLSNVQTSSSGMSGDVSCTMQDGLTSSGHIAAQFPDMGTVHVTINITMTMQGHTMPIAITSDSHFVSADCGDIQPGRSKVIQH
ncbi:MAG TPA: DUF3617 family protein [Acidobacteriaceae bacterium]|jgi:hypothetical protein